MKKLPLIAIILCTVWPGARSQSTPIDHWEMIIQNDDLFQYRTSLESDPGSQWREISYDASSWLEGNGGIGYGDGDDNTEISQCASVFIRKSFTVSSKADLIEGEIHIDYDDAFIAYINGVEIARSAGLTDPFPSPATLSTSQREYGSREVHGIENQLLQNVLVEGENIFTLQVHNASTTSSDLSSNTWLFIALATENTQFRDTPDWFSGPVSFTRSNLPIIVINTEGNVNIPDEPKVTAHMGIIYHEDGSMNYLSDAPDHYDGFIGIELRGNSTQNFPKKPYSLETRDSLGENLNVPLFGWPAENDWILRASYLDHTFVRNGLANYMSRKNGYWASRTQLVEVVLNGSYQGIYLFMEKIKRDDGRMDLANLLLADTTEPEVTGGYIWEITGFDQNIGSSRNLKYPDFDEAAPQQIDYITSTDDHFRSVMAGNNFTDSTNGYHALINTPSFVNEILVQEALRNSDAYGWSGYFHKDKEDKISAGPVWDFDQSAGNSSYPDNGVVTGWMLEHPNTSNTPFFWAKLFSDTVFAYEVRHNWERMREDAFSNEKLLGYVDSIANLLAEASVREFNKWPVLGQNIWRETNGYQDRDTYQKEIDYLKGFLEQRWAWMDNELAKYNNPYPPDTTHVIDTIIRDTIIYDTIYVDSIVFDTVYIDSIIIIYIDTTTIDTTVIVPYDLSDINCVVYPNPANEKLYFRIPGEENASYFIDIYNNQGRLTQRYGPFVRSGPGKSINIDIGKHPPGIYHYRIQAGNKKSSGTYVKLE